MEYTNSDEFLSAYLDRELSPDERAAMDRYLEKSPEARLRLRELEQTSRLVREMPREALGLDFAGSVIDRLRNESALRQPPVEPVRRRTVRLSWWSAGPMAAAAAVLFAVWMTNRSIPENNLPALRPIAEPIASVSAVGRWQDLKVGDFFNVLGPEGDTPFQLIVVA